MQPQERSLSWIGAASFGLAGTINFFNLGPVLSTVGHAGIVLFIIGMLLALLTGYGWLKIVLDDPEKVGGATVNSFKVFKSRSPLLLAILCLANWASWVAQASLSVTFCAAALIQWLPLSTDFHLFLSTILLCFCILLGLIRLTIAARIMIPIALITIFLLILSGIMPLFFGGFHTPQDFSLVLPFPGWFGYLTAIMSGFYLIGWIVPAYEVTTWLSGEMNQPQKNLPKAFFFTAMISSLTFIVLPIIWLGTLGYDQLIADYSIKKNWMPFNLLFSGLETPFATICGFLLVISYLLCSGIGSIIGPSRILLQLSVYGLLPYSLQKRLANGAPWVAVLITGAGAIMITWFGAPLWLIAATNFGYLASMFLASLGAWLLSREQRYQKDKIFNFFAITGLGASFLWILSIIFGYQQYGLLPMLGGVLLVLLGAIPYLYRKIMDTHQSHERISLYSIYVYLPLVFFMLFALNTSGYLLMLLKLPPIKSSMIAALHDIFITVVLLTITLGLWITGSVGYITDEISNAARKLSNTIMPELVKGMKNLGAGLLEKTNQTQHEKLILDTNRKDELGIMSQNFSVLKNQVDDLFLDMEATRQQLSIAKEKMLETQQQLYLAAHQAGMSQVAANVLHNVGNVFNSINISAESLKNRVYNSRLDKLNDVSQLLTEHQTSLVDFLTNNERGLALPAFLTAVTNYWKDEKNNLLKELELMSKHIDQIKAIISSQQSIGGASTIIQEIDLQKMINDALKIAITDNDQKGIKIIVNNSIKNLISIDKIKLLQVMINLIKNAREALIHAPIENKILQINAATLSENKFFIEVSDNGVGISEEHLRKIFQHGFTTKGNSHGFGLHSSALAAKEMEGELRVESEGLHKGARFVLELPYRPTSSS